MHGGDEGGWRSRDREEEETERGARRIKADRAARVKESRRRWGWRWGRYQLSQTKNNVFQKI